MSEYDGDNGLGDLPDDILDERGELEYIQKSDDYTNTRTTQNALAQSRFERTQEIEETGVMRAPKLPFGVQSTFDVRPVNGVDTLFGGVIQLRVPA